jgi:hypothetical protein
VTATDSPTLAPSLVGSTDSVGDREEPTAARRAPVGGADRIANVADDRCSNAVLFAERSPRGQRPPPLLDQILREAGSSPRGTALPPAVMQRFRVLSGLRTAVQLKQLAEGP